MLTATSKPIALQFGNFHVNIEVSLWAIQCYLVQLCSSMFMTARSWGRYAGLRVFCHCWNNYPLVSSQDSLCCAPLRGKAGVWLVRELNLHCRSISWCRQCVLQGSPIPWWGNCQAARVGCSAVEHPPDVLWALHYSLLEHWWWGRAVQQCLMVGFDVSLSSVKCLNHWEIKLVKGVYIFLCPPALQ